PPPPPPSPPSGGGGGGRWEKNSLNSSRERTPSWLASTRSKISSGEGREVGPPLPPGRVVAPPLLLLLLLLLREPLCPCCCCCPCWPCCPWALERMGGRPPLPPLLLFPWGWAVA